MVAICIGLCLLTSLVFGFLPAIRFSRPVIISALKDDAGAGGFRVGRVHRFTAALQVAIAVPLLVMGGIASIESAQRRHPISDLNPTCCTQRRWTLDGVPRRAAPASNPKPPGQSCQSERCCIRHRSGWPAAGLPRSRNATVSLQTEANVLRGSSTSR